MNERTIEFLDLYRELEQVIAAEYSLDETQSPVTWLLRKPQWRQIREDLDYCREVRNLLSHNPKRGGQFAVEPSEEMVELLRELILQIREPKRAKDICIPRERAVCCSLKDRVKPTLRLMHERNLSYVPILSVNRVIGVFGDDALSSLLLDRGKLELTNELTFGDIQEHLKPERCVVFTFVAEDTPLSKLEELFEKALKKGEHIGLVFVTKRGRQDEALRGILTPWDVAAID